MRKIFLMLILLLPQANYSHKLHKNDSVSDIDGIRQLTSRERSLIQTFPEDFYFSGTKTSVEQMLGNAVPVSFAKYIGSCTQHYASTA